MKVLSSFLHFEHTPALDDKIKEASIKMSMFFNDEGTMKWSCYVNNGDHFAEINYFAPHCEFHAKAISNNMYESIDLALEKIEKQASKKRDRLNKIHHGNLKIIE